MSVTQTPERKSKRIRSANPLTILNEVGVFLTTDPKLSFVELKLLPEGKLDAFGMPGVYEAYLTYTELVDIEPKGTQQPLVASSFKVGDRVTVKSNSPWSGAIGTVDRTTGHELDGEPTCSVKLDGRGGSMFFLESSLCSV